LFRKIKRAIVISDVHLGEKDCLFNDKKILNEFKSRIIDETKNGKIDELIITGDLLDLSLATYKEVYKSAKDFFQTIGQIEHLDRIVFIPGNHDHHIWTLLIEEEQITNKIRDSILPEPELKRVNLVYGENRSTFLNGLIKNCKVTKLLVAYPNLFREIGEELYFFHHGHLLDRMFTPANVLIKPESLQELEAFNSSWTEGIFYHLVQSARLGDMIKNGYSELTGMKKIMETFLEKFHIEDNKIISRMRGMRVEKITHEINDYLESCIDWYKGTEHKLFTPLNFVFGHTHRKSEGEMVELKNQKINIYNTGAWHRDKNLASYLVITEKERPVLKLSIYII